MSESKFDKWFKRQFGKRIGVGFAWIDDSDLEVRIERGRLAQEELSRRKQWDEMYRAASYAWQVKEESK